MPETSFPESWNDVFAELDLKPRSTSPPDGESAGDWQETYANFGDRGFLRLTLCAEPCCRFHLQLALPDPEDPDATLRVVAAELGDILDTDWETSDGAPPWTLRAETGDGPTADALRELHLRAMTLGDHVDEAGRLPDWLNERLDGEAGRRPTDSSDDTTSSRRTSRTRQTTQDSSSSGIFEAIGDEDAGRSKSGGSTASTVNIQGAGLADFEVRWEDDDIVVSLALNTTLPSNDAEAIARALAHALRARYDISARPLPHEDFEGDGVGDRAGTQLGLHVGPPAVDLDRDGGLEDGIAEDLEGYFDRLKRFGELGMSLGEVLGLEGDDTGRSRSTRSHSRDSDRDSDREESRDRRRSRRSDRSDRRRRSSSRSTRRGTSKDTSNNTASPSDSRRRPPAGPSGRRDRSGSDPAPSDPSDQTGGVVLGLGSSPASPTSSGDSAPAAPTTADAHPESPLEQGNYTDPRLMREDADTRLVDVVLRHPGYAERKMAHNLSILLSVDYGDAVDLVESAPCVIAWGVGLERAQNFKRVIEKAGGKVVLIEPDSLER